MVRCLHDGENLQPISGVRRVIPSCINHTLEEMCHLHSWSDARAVQSKPESCPGDIFILLDAIIHQEKKVSHRDRLPRRWDMPVELFPLCRHCCKGHSGWEWGAVYCILIPSLRPDPYLANKGCIGCKEVFYRWARFFCPSAPVPQERRLDWVGEGPGTLLVPLANYMFIIKVSNIIDELICSLYYIFLIDNHIWQTTKTFY